MRLTPGGAATYLIDHLHHAVKPLLALTCVAAILGVGAAAALLHRHIAAAAFGAAVLLAGLLAPVQPAPAGALAGAILAAAGYATALAALPALAPSPQMPDPARRRALVRLGTLVLAGGTLDVLGALAGHGGSARLLELVPVRARSRLPFPRIGGLTPEVTAVADHYIVDFDIEKPVVDAASWRLRVDGLVQRPLALGFEELQRRFALVSEHAVLTCISNPVGGPLVGNSLWQGVRLRDLLEQSGASPAAWGVAVSCADGYTAGIPLDVARHPSSLVAIAQDGQPLAVAHGFPCRLRIPALYGMLNPKWVTGIRVVAAPFTGYWAQQGWSRTAVVRTESRIDTPGRARAGEPTWIAGLAWAGLRGIARVEVSTDGGRRWHPAILHPALSPWAWTQWAYQWTPATRGRYELLCRATDGRGNPQDALSRPPHPSGASGYPRRVVRVT